MRRLQPCSVKEVTIGFEAGKGKEKDVSIAPPNSKTGDMGGPGPGHAAFCDARLAEVENLVDDAARCEGLRHRDVAR